MKTKILILVLVATLFVLSTCQKDAEKASSVVTVTKPVVQKMNDLDLNTSFAWRTTKTYEFTFKGNVKDFVSIVSPDGSVYHKALLTPQTSYKITLSLPTFETKVHFLYNNTDTEYLLNSPTVNYTFK